MHMQDAGVMYALPLGKRGAWLRRLRGLLEFFEASGIP
jgi:hypothetical protein